MKIKKVANKLIAYAEKGDNEGRSAVGESLGSINIKTGKFNGNTCCLIPLNEALDKLKAEKKTKVVYVLVRVELESAKEITDDDVELFVEEMDYEINPSACSGDGITVRDTEIAGRTSEYPSGF